MKITFILISIMLFVARPTFTFAQQRIINEWSPSKENSARLALYAEADCNPGPTNNPGVYYICGCKYIIWRKYVNGVWQRCCIGVICNSPLWGVSDCMGGG